MRARAAWCAAALVLSACSGPGATATSTTSVRSGAGATAGVTASPSATSPGSSGSATAPPAASAPASSSASASTSPSAPSSDPSSATGSAAPSVPSPAATPAPGTGAAAAAGAAGGPGAPGASAGTPGAAATTGPSLPRGIRSVVALGDSVPAGTGSDATAFPEALARLFAPANPGVRATNLGTDGATTPTLVQALLTDDATRGAVRGADVVVVTVGANDLYPARDVQLASGCDAGCRAGATGQVGDALGRALDAVRGLARPGTRVLVTTYWSVFEDGAVARGRVDAQTRAWSDALTRETNAVLCSTARAHGATCVDLYGPFKGDGTGDPTGLLAPDGDHPNQAGHDLVARTLLTALGQR